MRLIGCACVIVAALLAAPAAAQDCYDAVERGAPWTDRPAASRTITVAATELASVAVPFRWHYFGERVDALALSPRGWAVPAPGSAASAALGAGAIPDGALAVRAGGLVATSIRTWTTGDAPGRNLVLEWEFENGASAARLTLHEAFDRVAFAYHAAPRTGDAERPSFTARLDEPGGERFAEPVHLTRDAPPLATVFAPRTAVFNPPGIPQEGVPARWLETRKESTVPDGCTKRCTYLGRGRGYFHVPQRAAPDADGDDTRWVRQVLDGKIVFLPAPGGAPVRVWFRIVEYFSLDQRGTTLADHHVWNLRWMLRSAFPGDREHPGDDPRRAIDGYYAWRATAHGRLTVGKLFAASQTDDAGRQYDSGRKNEYVLWSGHVTHGTRGALAPAATPTTGWTRFTLREDDMRVTQHAERNDVRFVPDPSYVDGHYEYVVAAPDNPFGWITGRGVPAPPLRDEPLDVDPGRASGPVTPR